MKKKTQRIVVSILAGFLAAVMLLSLILSSLPVHAAAAKSSGEIQEQIESAKKIDGTGEKSWLAAIDRLPHLDPGDTLVYGHTHVKVNEARPDGIWLFNPGSVGIPKDGTHSYGIYEDGCFEHRILDEA